MATNNATNTQKPITVANGGTGLSTVTSDAVLVGSGAGAITPVSGSDNQILAGNTAADPSFSGTPAVTSISFDSGTNALDAYVETTAWTPELEFGGASTGISYSLQQGFYTRIGDIVYAQVFIVLTSKGTATGNARVENFPLTFRNIEQFTKYAYVVNVTFNNTAWVVPVGSSTALGLFQQTSGGFYGFLTDANFANNSTVSFSVMAFL
jgi:hypothetical protein